MITKSQALHILRPNAQWALRDDNLEWLDKTQTKPTEKEIQDKIKELEALEPMKRLRSHRDKLLTETDWWVLPDRTPTSEQLAYRQALRDLPSTVTPVLDPTTRLGISGFDWPIKP